MTTDSLYEHVGSALSQVSSRGGDPIILANDDDKDVDTSRRIIRIPRTVDCLQGLLNIIPLQILSYYMCISTGKDPDNPRCASLALLVSMLVLTRSRICRNLAKVYSSAPG